MKRLLWLGFMLSLYVVCSGCGDTFRPIIIPNPPTFPNPKAAHTVVAINYNELYTEFDVGGNLTPTFVPVTGSAMVIDVSGDSEVSVANVGLAPVHAVQQSASEVLVVNQAQTLSNNVPTSSCNVSIPNTNQTFDVCPTLTVLNFSGTTIGSTSTISLPIYSSPNFVAAAPSATTAYVTLPTYPPNPDQQPPQTIVPSVGVISTASRSLVATVPVVYTPPGKVPVLSNPYALAVTPDSTKLYVANNSSPCNPPTAGICSISAFNTAGPSTRGIIGSLSYPPIWLSARSDSQAVYVLEDNGTLAYINILSSSGPDTLTETTSPLIQVPGATTMTYDPNLNRLYIPGGQQLAIVDVSQSPPQYLAGGAPIPTCDLAPKSTNCIPTAAPSSRVTSDPCSLTSPQTLTVVAVAALPGESRSYVGAYYQDVVDNVNYICPQVTVIDATSNTTEAPSIAIPGFPDATNPNYANGQYYVPVCVSARFRFMMAAGGDSSRAYLSSCDGGMVNIIDTFTDTYIENLPAPIGSLPPIPPSQLNPPQNPVFLFAGP